MTRTSKLFQAGRMIRSIGLGLTVGYAMVAAANADDDHSHSASQSVAVVSPVEAAKVADFDIVSSQVTRNGRFLTFTMATAGIAGESRPEATGDFAGTSIWAYVWPTSLDPSSVGFEGNTGILALAATNHPDFDDTPLFDENVDGDTGNDGAHWHSHWVVLVPNEDCGPGALAVRDIPEGETPQMPATWPGVPMFLDSPGFTPVFDGPSITINAVLANADIATAENASFDGVTSALKVNVDLHAPLACVVDVFDVASGDLSLPGKIN